MVLYPGWKPLISHVICEDREEAKALFYIFLDYLRRDEKESDKAIKVTNVYEKSFMVDTSQNMRYVFLPKRMIFFLGNENLKSMIDANDFYDMLQLYYGIDEIGLTNSIINRKGE